LQRGAGRSFITTSATTGGHEARTPRHSGPRLLLIAAADRFRRQARFIGTITSKNANAARGRCVGVPMIKRSGKLPCDQHHNHARDLDDLADDPAGRAGFARLTAMPGV
jgi:hypothetical protein